MTETQHKESVVALFKASGIDTGSTAVQIAQLTERILALTEHLKVNKKDFSSKRGLLKMVSTRRSLLKYLKRIDAAMYIRVTEKFALKQ